MVKEAKKTCYGMWNFPAGHVNEGESFSEAALCEVLEETGCSVTLESLVSITTENIKDETVLFIHYLARMKEENMTFNKNEILDVKWIDIQEVLNMSSMDLRGCVSNQAALLNALQKRVFPLDVLREKIS